MVDCAPPRQRIAPGPARLFPILPGRVDLVEAEAAHRLAVPHLTAVEGKALDSRPFAKGSPGRR